MTRSIFWSIVLSIPVSIGSGLLVPVIQDWVGRRGKAKRAKLRQVEEEKYREALVLMVEPFYLTQYMLLHGTLAVLFGVAILGGLMFSFHGFSIQISHPSDPFYAAHPLMGRIDGFIYQIIGWALLFSGSWQEERCMETMIGVWSRANNFERYEQTVPKDIRSKYQELRDKITSSRR
jgi:hypothetical protein